MEQETTSKVKTGSHSNHTQVVRSSATIYSAEEYAWPVWERSTRAKKLNTTLNETCRMVTDCLKPTNTNSLPILAGIAPSDIRRVAASRTEWTRKTTDERHPLNGLKSSLSYVTPEIAEQFNQN